MPHRTVREPRLANIVQAAGLNIVHAKHGYRPAQPDIVPNSAPAKILAINWESGLKSRAPTHDLTADQDIVQIPDVGFSELPPNAKPARHL